MTGAHGWRTAPEPPSRPTLLQTLLHAMSSVRDVGPLESLYPSQDNFEAPDEGQYTHILAWSPTMVWYRRDKFGGPYRWEAVPRHPILSTSTMLALGYL